MTITYFHRWRILRTCLCFRYLRIHLEFDWTCERKRSISSPVSWAYSNCRSKECNALGVWWFTRWWCALLFDFAALNRLLKGWWRKAIMNLNYFGYSRWRLIRIRHHKRGVDSNHSNWTNPSKTMLPWVCKPHGNAVRIWRATISWRLFFKTIHYLLGIHYLLALILSIKSVFLITVMI